VFPGAAALSRLSFFEMKSNRLSFFLNEGRRAVKEKVFYNRRSYQKRDGYYRLSSIRQFLFVTLLYRRYCAGELD
jgi:hypothetical protein